MTYDAALDDALNMILLDEGGVADVGDGKGITRWGQTDQWLFQNNLKRPASLAEARNNYRIVLSSYGLDALRPRYPSFAFAYVLTTYAVHAGELQAIRDLQRCLKVAADGRIGPKTIQAVSRETGRHLAARLIGKYLRYLGATLKSNPQRVTYVNGWMRRAAELVEAVGYEDV